MKGWDPIQMGTPTPDGPSMTALREHPKGWLYAYRPQMGRVVGVRAFYNRLYNGSVHDFEDLSIHIDFKRNDRSAVRDWRHFQAIKNSVAGPEREAIEIFPPESQLLDGANQYHLWVLPPGAFSPLGMWAGRGVLPASNTHDHARYRLGGAPGGTQRGFEPGIPTGLELDSKRETVLALLLDADAEDPDVLVERIMSAVVGP